MVDKRATGGATRYDRLSVWLLSVMGVYILVAPWLAPELLHWNRITASVGGEAAFVRVALGVLFIYFALLTHEKYVLKTLNRDLVEAFNVAMYGEHYRQHRATVESLIDSLASASDEARERAHGALRTMTGQALPADHDTWSAWWSQARNTFRLSGEKVV